ncbi:hypothetical protein I6F35_33550 [Bradyrhizobium sp. BRP22]|uniref:hypothetical protein n=1 Tax=Bradyrhizobium sp. BRP22 TaxID=2793821 RepID=UPI001CD44361|nr:hypothetical protein [Bradyrhizobium sp. BRP22]MCA1458061.1 hypothetical protein [Bradyrhizobium sp. BRP22]
MPIAYLVWVQGPKGPCPQIWHDDGDRFVGPSDLPVLDRRPLAAGAKLDLELLTHLYPFTATQEAA